MDDLALHHAIAAALGVADADIDANSDMSNTPHWDSMRQVMLMTELEGVFGVVFADEDILGATSVAKIKDALACAPKG